MSCACGLCALVVRDDQGGYGWNADDTGTIERHRYGLGENLDTTKPYRDFEERPVVSRFSPKQYQRFSIVPVSSVFKPYLSLSHYPPTQNGIADSAFPMGAAHDTNALAGQPLP